MKFKTDENLPLEAAELLRSEGWDAQSVCDQGLSGTKYPDLMNVCLLEDRALVTLDLGFADIRAYPPSAHPGIIVLRPPNQSKTEVVSLMRRLIPTLASEPIRETLWVVDDKRIRIRRE